ncbi:hypothetical protein PROFUN_01587 [Planoprotostelium fungivorum]|uniref:G-protein coupled receptors family 2 profile 2 domain-containing protein n=1 Tax=Planoprotostelium fungivorum TaxID=1890364 RepID=A0A2P6NTM4_9EUKA|nr:hypothetical protein PROFUN_01587 [Planoprotostelium fungivorum]
MRQDDDIILWTTTLRQLDASQKKCEKEWMSTFFGQVVGAHHHSQANSLEQIKIQMLHEIQTEDSQLRKERKMLHEFCDGTKKLMTAMQDIVSQLNHPDTNEESRPKLTSKLRNVAQRIESKLDDRQSVHRPLANALYEEGKKLDRALDNFVKFMQSPDWEKVPQRPPTEVEYQPFLERPEEVEEREAEKENMKQKKVEERQSKQQKIEQWKAERAKKEAAELQKKEKEESAQRQEKLKKERAISKFRERQKSLLHQHIEQKREEETRQRMSCRGKVCMTWILGFRGPRPCEGGITVGPLPDKHAALCAEGGFSTDFPHTSCHQEANFCYFHKRLVDADISCRTEAMVQCTSCVIVSSIATLSCLSAATMIGCLFLFKMHKSRPGQLLLFLAIADFLQSIAIQLSYAWTSSGITQNSLCTFQGFLINFTDIASSLMAGSICVYTVIIGICRIRIRHFVPLSVAFSFGFPFILSIAGLIIGSRDHRPFYQPTSAWCWITEVPYGTYRVTFHYLWIIITLAVMLGMYALMGYRMTVTMHLAEQFSTKKSEEEREKSKNIVLNMIWYPIVFCIVFMPLALARLVVYGGGYVSDTYTMVAVCLFSCNGFLNFVSYGLTRRMHKRFHTWFVEGSSSVQNESIEVMVDPLDFIPRSA